MKLKYNSPDTVTQFINCSDSIFHYTKKETAIEHVLNGKKLKFGDFKLTNDPHEYKKRMITPVGWGPIKDHLSKLAEIIIEIDKIIKSSGFLSFCQNNYINNELVANGCLKSRMWSQYGENHSGICLVFSKSKLIQEIENQFSSFFSIYSDSIKYIDFDNNRAVNDHLRIDGQELSVMKVDEIAAQYISAKNKEIFFYKQIDYRDENEFRIVSVPKVNKNSNGVYFDISHCIRTIILGDAFSEVYLPSIQALSNELNVPYRKLHWEKNSYFLMQ